jgi:hypothetical protein
MDLFFFYYRVSPYNFFPQKKNSDGPEYTASKTWKILDVSIDWLIDSCVRGVKADENKYSIVSGNNYEEFIQYLDKIRRNLSITIFESITILNIYFIPFYLFNKYLETNYINGLFERIARWHIYQNGLQIYWK